MARNNLSVFVDQDWCIEAIAPDASGDGSPLRPIVLSRIVGIRD
jgi:hypothetical protein